MIKNLFKDSMVYGLANGVQKLSPFFIIPIITGALGADALKLYDIAFVYAYLFSWLIIMGQDAAASILYFDKKENTFQQRQVTAYAFWIQCLMLLFFALLFLFFKNFFAASLFSGNVLLSSYWLKALLIIPGHIFLNYSLNLLLWKGRKSAYIFLCLLQTFLSVVGVYAVVIWLNAGVDGLFYVLISATWISGVAGIFLNKAQIFIKPLPVNKILLRRLLWLGLPFALTAFLQQLLPSIDRYFLLRNGFQQQMAPYILAVKLGAFINLGISAFVLAFTPYSMSRLHQPNGEKEISHLFRIVSILAFLMVPVMLIFKTPMILLFANASYSGAEGLLPLFFFGWVFDLFSYFSMLGVYKSQNAFFVLLLFAAATCLICFLNIALIPRFGFYGAAIGFCATKALMFFASLIFLRRYFKVTVHVPEFLFVLGIAVACTYLQFILPVAWNVAVLIIVLCAAGFYLYRLYNTGLKPANNFVPE